MLDLLLVFVFIGTSLVVPADSLIYYVHLLFDEPVILRRKYVSKALYCHHGDSLSIYQELASLDEVRV